MIFRWFLHFFFVFVRGMREWAIVFGLLFVEGKKGCALISKIRWSFLKEIYRLFNVNNGTFSTKKVSVC